MGDYRHMTDDLTRRIAEQRMMAVVTCHNRFHSYRVDLARRVRETYPLGLEILVRLPGKKDCQNATVVDRLNDLDGLTVRVENGDLFEVAWRCVVGLAPAESDKEKSQ